MSEVGAMIDLSSASNWANIFVIGYAGATAVADYRGQKVSVLLLTVILAVSQANIIMLRADRDLWKRETMEWRTQCQPGCYVWQPSKVPGRDL